MDARRPQLSAQLRPEQQMLLLPQLLQSIELLQLPHAELEQYLENAAQENVALQWPELRRSPLALARASQEHDEFLHSQPARPASLTEIVLANLATAECTSELLPWVRLLIDHLDSAGFLSCGDEVLLASARERGLIGDAGTLGRALAALQSLEPRGIGARNAIEALLLQLEPSDPDYPLLCRLLEEFLEELAKNKLPRVARAMGVDLAELQRLLSLLGSLNPRPLASLCEELAPRLQAELVVEWDGKALQVRLLRSNLDSVRIDPAVDQLARDKKQSTQVRRYLRERIERARWIVRALEQRQSTLLSVAAAVFRRQSAFLSFGPGHLLPLRMGEVAKELGIHLSTVSRAVSGKYVETPWGVMPLRSFFPNAGAGEEDVVRDDLRECVRALIEAEDPRSPKSDDDLCTELEKQGHPIARRTVAKYRAELGIKSSYRRRHFEESEPS